jgi:hypothetical protein
MFSTKFYEGTKMKKDKQSLTEKDVADIIKSYDKNNVSLTFVFARWIGTVLAWGLMLLALLALYAGFVGLTRYIWG